MCFGLKFNIVIISVDGDILRVSEEQYVQVFPDGFLEGFDVKMEVYGSKVVKM